MFPDVVPLDEAAAGGFKHFFKEHRLATFAQWPFVSGCSCTPIRMAEAGFIHCPSDNTPDVVQCFICFKELEGWEPEDDPMEEHRKHSQNCAFLAIQKDISEMSMQEFMKLNKERMKNLVKKQVNQKINDFEKYAESIRNQLKLLD